MSAYLRPQLGRVAVLLLRSIGLQLLNPQILSAFIDATTSHATVRHLSTIAVLFICVALAQQTLSVAATYVSERVGWTATNALRADLTMHCLHLDLAFHKARTPGELIERIDGDVTAIANFFSQFVIRVVGSLLMMLGVILMLSTVNWRAGVAFGLFSLVVLTSMSKIRAIAVPYWRAGRQTSADLFGFLEERLSSTVDIRSCGAQPYIMQRLYGYTRARLRAGSKARVVSEAAWCIPIASFAVGNVLALTLIAYLYRTS